MQSEMDWEAEATPVPPAPITTEVQTQPKVPSHEAKALSVDKAGALALSSLEDQLSFANRLLKEGMVSETFKTPQQLVVAFQYAKAMKMNELLAIKFMYVINGRPCLYSEGPLALCQRSGLVSGLEEFFIDENFERVCVEKKNLKAPIYGAVTRIQRRGDSMVQEDYFTLDDLKRAGIDRHYGKKKDVWEKWERLMMRYKARTIALRSKFADLIAGIPIAEYDFHQTPEIPEITELPRRTAADELNETYGKDVV